jgi:hypothetical protein
MHLSHVHCIFDNSLNFKTVFPFFFLEQVGSFRYVFQVFFPQRPVVEVMCGSKFNFALQ